MRQSEAAMLVAELAAYWPSSKVTTETSELWESALAPYDIEDGREAVQLLGVTRIYMPSLAEFSAVIRDCRNVRVANRALPGGTGGVTFYDWFHHDPTATPELRAIAELCFPLAIAEWLKGNTEAGIAR
jgi:hypothetical protein